MTDETRAEVAETEDLDDDDSADSLFGKDKSLETQYKEFVDTEKSDDGESKKAAPDGAGSSEDSEVKSPPTDSNDVEKLVKSVQQLVEHQVQGGKTTNEEKASTLPDSFELSEEDMPEGFAGMHAFFKTAGVKQLEQMKAVLKETHSQKAELQGLRDEIDVKFLMMEMGVNHTEELKIGEYASKRGFSWTKLDSIRELVEDHRKLMGDKTEKDARQKRNNPNPASTTRKGSANADSEDLLNCFCLCSTPNSTN